MRGAVMNLSAAASGFVLFLLSLSVVQSRHNYGVIYTSTPICAVKGSTVDIGCSITNPSRSYPLKKVWFNKGNDDKPEDLKTDPAYADRVTYSSELKSCNLTIRDLRESDSAVYKFRSQTYGPSFTVLPGVNLTVIALQVKVSRIISVHESQTEAELKCESSCSPAGRLSFVWFKNNQFMFQQSSYRDLFSPGDIVFCALEGHKDYRSDPVDIPEFTAVSVSPSAEIVEGSSVTLTCSSDANPAASYTWYKDKKTISRDQEITFSSIQSADSGEYYCTAENELGKWSRIEYISIKVNYAPKLPSVSVSPSKERGEGRPVTPSGEISEERPVTPSGEISEERPVTLTRGTVTFYPGISNNQDSWKKPAAVASITVLLLAVIIIGGIVLIRRKWCFKANLSRGRPDNKPEENAYCYYTLNTPQRGRPECDGPSAPAQSTAAEQQQEDLCYSTVTFIKKPEEHDYYNILPMKAKRRKERDEEVKDVDYTVVRLNSTQRLRDQQAAECSPALYSTVRKK